MDNKLIQALVAAATGLLLGGGGMLQLGNRDMASVGSGVEQIVIANARNQAIIFNELSECRETLEKHE